MHLIIDSGASKTEYLFILKNIYHYRSVHDGININYVTDDELERIISTTLTSFPTDIMEKVKKVTFYGAGCSTIQNASRIKNVLLPYFPQLSISVFSDLLAACHALCGEKPGWVAVLGTGSSSCIYDGNRITSIAPSLGYLLGDEGSGTHLGKMFLSEYLWGNLSQELKREFEEEFSLNPSRVVEHIYRKPFPNRFMASFAPFILDHIDNQKINTLCKASFSEFFTKQSHYFQHLLNNKELNIIGSVAFYFNDIIKETANEMNISIGKIISAPSDYLADYYYQLEMSNDK